MQVGQARQLPLAASQACLLAGRGGDKYRCDYCRRHARTCCPARGRRGISISISISVRHQAAVYLFEIVRCAWPGVGLSRGGPAMSSQTSWERPVQREMASSPPPMPAAASLFSPPRPDVNVPAAAG